MTKVWNTLWTNRSKKGKTGIILLALLLIGAATGGTSGTSGGSQPASQSAASGASAPKRTAPAVTGKVRGYFSRGLLDGGLDQADLAKYIRTSNVWCGWKDGKVVVHVTMRNDSAEHVTIYWNPRYTIRAGGIHGDGLTAAEDDGFDSGETRSLISEQQPKGVAAGKPLASCSPHFEMINSG
jgi:hypothetical protein